MGSSAVRRPDLGQRLAHLGTKFGSADASDLGKQLAGLGTKFTAHHFMSGVCVQ